MSFPPPRLYYTLFSVAEKRLQILFFFMFFVSGYNSLRKVPRPSERRRRLTTLELASGENTPYCRHIDAVSMTADDIRQKHAILCQKIFSYRIGLTELSRGSEPPDHLHGLYNDIQHGIASLGLQLDGLPATAGEDRQTRQLHLLVCDLDRQLMLCKRQRRAALRTAKRQRCRSPAEEEDDNEQVAVVVQQQPRLSLPNIEADINEKSSPRASVQEDDGSSCLPSLTDAVVAKSVKVQQRHYPPLKFMRQASNMAYPFSSCFPSLPPAPKNRVVAESRLPVGSLVRQCTMQLQPAETSVAVGAARAARKKRLTRDKTWMV